MKYNKMIGFIVFFLFMAFYNSFTFAQAPCPFNTSETCTLIRDILNDHDANGLAYYGPTNYDHRVSGEIEVFNSNLVQPYNDSVNAPGQIKLIANINPPGNPAFYSGEIMTRTNLNLPPYNSPAAIHPFTTEAIQHGYLEAVVKLPQCVASTDGLCQNGTNPTSYNSGMWPSVWLLPTMDTNWPENGEIDIWEAYKLGLGFNVTTATLHFNGTSPRCGNNDCVGVGFPLAAPAASSPLWEEFHTWGFEWQPDPNSTDNGFIMTGYFDNQVEWGPVTTDSLPADGPNAFSRGFNDPNGGFYVISALAIGGPYAGAPDPHMQSAVMYIQSLKAYSVGNGTPSSLCLPPANIQSSYTADKKSITLTWQQPANSSPISSYQVNNWQNQSMWQGNALTFTDNTLPGTNGTFTYYLLSNCTGGASTAVPVNVTINSTTPPPTQCLPPANPQYTSTADKKSITLTWQQPANSSPISSYQVNNWQNQQLWQGNALTFTDNTLPGTNGTFTYFLLSNCAGAGSVPVQVNAQITGTPPNPCLPPANVQYTFSANKKSVTLTWQQPSNSSNVLNYQVNNWQNQQLWQGNVLTFTDNTLPGTNGKFVYYLYSNCASGLSAKEEQDVIIQ